MNMMVRSDALRPQTAAGAVSKGRVRDPRLDFFRGYGMYVILIAHIPRDPWDFWIPPRFGFSDSTEIFVFLSGIASAIAFGSTFDKRGFVLGLARVLFRVWQVYWVHVGVFVAGVAVLAAAGATPEGVSYLHERHLDALVADPGAALARFLALVWAPNYFDILPMYLVLLAMMPAMLALERLDRRLPVAVAGALWLAVQTGVFDLPGEAVDAQNWFFNPFAWQVLFYAGFFLKRGAIPAPPRRGWLVVAAAAVLVLAVPVSWRGIVDGSPVFGPIFEALEPWTDKTHFAVLRPLHFAAIAYLAYQFVPPTSRVLHARFASVVRTVGQQSLAVFASSIVLAQILGIVLERIGRDDVALVALVNVAGLAVLTAVAYTAAWFKSAPWKAATPAGAPS